MRLGPLVYLLPLYSPLRLIEEICMLDHLSHGRLDVGVGRGVSPYELKYHKVEHDQSRDIFVDAFDCISAGLTTDSLTYKGEHFIYDNVPIALRPLQQPHPPFWYASSNEIGVDLGRRARPAFRDAWADADRQGQYRRVRTRWRNAAAGAAEAGVSRRRGDRRVAPHFRRRHRGGSARRFGKPAMEASLRPPQMAAPPGTARPA